MPSTYTIVSTLKPYSSGMIFANSATDDEQGQQIIYIGILNTQIEFEYSYGGVFGFKQNNVKTGRNLHYYLSSNLDAV